MLRQHPVPTAEQLAQAERFNGECNERHRRAEESFQRCNTDDFLCQWASGLGAQRDRANAEILRYGGYAEFSILCDRNGNVIADKIFHFDGQWGRVSKWRLPGELVAKTGRKWVPAGSNSRAQKQMQLHEETRWFRAVAVIAGSAIGLSGQAWVEVVRRRD